MSKEIKKKKRKKKRKAEEVMICILIPLARSRITWSNVRGPHWKETTHIKGKKERKEQEQGK